MDIKKIRCLVVDDEIIARRGLMRQLNHLGQIEIIGEANNFDEFISLVQSEKPDVVFLDICLHKTNAVEALPNIDFELLPPIVFTTAYSEYASNSYELNAVDYLLKPISDERLKKSIIKIQNKIALLEDKSQSNNLFIKSNGKYFRIVINDILYIQSMENYVQIFTNTQKFICKSTMEQICKSLPTAHFMRVHRSFLINKTKVDTIEKLSVSIQGNKIPVSRDKKKLVFAELVISNV